MPQTPEDKARQTKIEPAIRSFLQKMEKEGLEASALIFDPKGEFLIRRGNKSYEGKDLVRLHYFLSLTCVYLEILGHFEPTEPSASHFIPDPLENADKLVLALLAMPCEMLPNQILELVQQYAESRKNGIAS